ncbi:MAG TPA: SDR family oxidoreductase [Isosphaeraceae bacterium]|jgi:uncharacterized protein YbjT (DUF2867 family)|nr:SDR family oxidoreductase [Isosphaeraceae bacterium]
MILVIGATGTNGREVVDRLVATGRKVRALVRAAAGAGGPGQRGVEVVPGDLGDPRSLAKALEGVERAFYLGPVDPRAEEWFANVLDATRQAGTKHLVKFSGMGAGVEASSEIMRMHGRTDEALVASGLPFTILRPNSFYQNMLWSAATIRDRGAFYQPIGDARQSFVDVRDIADVAVAALTGPGLEGETIEITGPEALSFHDVAAKLSAALGRAITYVPVSLDDAYNGMIQAGMPEWNARELRELYGAFAAGGFDRTNDAVEQIAGHPPIAFDRIAREYADAFGGAGATVAR